jgi:hypothetical protein
MKVYLDSGDKGTAHYGRKGPLFFYLLSNPKLILLNLHLTNATTK